MREVGSVRRGSESQRVQSRFDLILIRDFFYSNLTLQIFFAILVVI